MFAILACLIVVSGLPQASEARDWKVEAEGQLGLEGRFFPDATGQARSSETWISPLLDFSLKNRQLRRWSLSTRVSGQYLVGDENRIWNQSGSPHYFEETELALEYRIRRHRFRVGTSTLRWGILDLYDPLDQVNSRRFENPISSEKRGDLMLLWQYSKPGREVSANFEAFYIPRKKLSILPSEKSTWLPREVYVPNLSEAEFLLPRELVYQYLGHEELDGSLSHAYGARIVFRADSTETALQYDEGASAFPNVRPEVSGTVVAVPPQSDRTQIQADPLIKLTEVYYRERHFGGSFTKSFATSLLRLQIARTERLYAGRDLARDRTDLTIGYEKSIGASTLLAQVYANLLRLDVKTSDSVESGNDLASMSSLFDRAFALGWRYPLGDSSSLLVGGLYAPGSQTDGWTAIGMSSLSLALTDSLTMDFGFNLIESGKRGPLSPFARNDGAQLKLTAIF